HCLAEVAHLQRHQPAHVTYQSRKHEGRPAGQPEWAGGIGRIFCLPSSRRSEAHGASWLKACVVNRVAHTRRPDQASAPIALRTQTKYWALVDQTRSIVRLRPRENARCVAANLMTGDQCRGKSTPKINYGPVIVSRRSERPFGSDPCRGLSISYSRIDYCHGRGSSGDQRLFI